MEPHGGVGVDPSNAVGGRRLRTLKFGQLEKMRKNVELLFVNCGVALLLWRWAGEEWKRSDAQRGSNHSLQAVGWLGWATRLQEVLSNNPQERSHHVRGAVFGVERGGRPKFRNFWAPV